MNVHSASQVKRLTGWLVTTLFMAAFAGCSVMSKDECAKADWRQIGLSDASEGWGSERLKTRREACAKHTMNLDEGTYRVGYAEGQKVYCTTTRGRAHGTAGDEVPEVCTSLPDAQFSDAYHAGLQSFCTHRGGYQRGLKGLPYLGQCPPEVEDKVKLGLRQGKEIYDLNSRLASIEKDKKAASSTLGNDKATASERQTARSRLSELRADEASVRQMLTEAEVRALQMPALR
jgi:hypothetical protein